MVEITVDEIKALSNVFEIKKKQTDSAAQTRRELVLATHGSLENYHHGLEFVLVTKPEDAAFEGLLYPLYETIFTMPEERESLEGLAECMKFPARTDVQKKFGFCEEAWIGVLDPKKGELLGATNFSTYDTGTGQTIYIFTRPDARRLGLAQLLLQIQERYSRNRLEGRKGSDALFSTPSDRPFAVFTEQNDPLKMTLREYIIDQISAVIDPCDRNKFWVNRGHKKIASFSEGGFDYVQPALEQGALPGDYVAFFAKSDANVIPSLIVSQHLQRFFGLSIFRERDCKKDPDYCRQIDQLDLRTELPLAFYPADTVKPRIQALILKALKQGIAIEDKPFCELLNGATIKPNYQPSA